MHMVIIHLIFEEPFLWLSENPNHIAPENKKVLIEFLINNITAAIIATL